MNTAVQKVNGTGIPRTDSLAEFHLLHEIEASPGISQREISKRLGISLGLTNLIIRKMIRKAWIKVSTVPGRRLLYALTPQGASEKIRKASDFLRLSLRYYSDMKHSLAERIRQTGRAHPTVASYGAGEFAGIVAEAAQEAGGRYVGGIGNGPKEHVADVVLLLAQPSRQQHATWEEQRRIVIDVS